MHWFVVLLLCVAAVAGSCPWDDATLKPWSAASSWPGSKLPLMGQDVVIGAGMNILLDTTTQPAKSIRIENGGSLVWANIDGLQLIGAEVVVTSRGSLWIGNDECPFTRTASIVLGGDIYSKIAEFGQIITMPGLDGFLELHDGTPRPFFSAVNKRADYISGEASIPSNFNVTAELVPSWGTGEIPGSGVPDVVGAFRFICNPSHELYDDPVVYPGQPGGSHLHSFFGNTLADAYSTYQSLRTKGNSTCNSPLNRSSYWMPSMLDGRGNVIRPDYISIYYKRRPSNDTHCKVQGKGCIGIPRGLKYIFGFDMVNGTAATGGGYFNCQGPNATSDHYPTLVAASKFCPPGSQIGALIGAPDCWDGKRLDSFNHRDHMSYGSYGHWGYYKCPDSHPWVIPAFTLGAWFSDSNKTFDYSKYDNKTSGYSSWHLSSDVQYSGVVGYKLTPGTTMHADWFGAWDDSVMKMWEDNCIEKLLSCSGGDLGNGLQLKMFSNFTWGATPEQPRLFPMPAHPGPSTPTTRPPSSSSTGSSSTRAPSSTASASTAAPSTASPTSPPAKGAASSLPCVAAFVVAGVSALALML